jgi:hypothetical protein
MKKIKQFTVSRSKWGRGATGGVLLREDSRKMCCLGFFCRAAGIEPKTIRGVGAPDQLILEKSEELTKPQKECLLPLIDSDYAAMVDTESRAVDNNNTCYSLMSVNDTIKGKYAKDENREARLIELFKQLGIKVKFIP